MEFGIRGKRALVCAASKGLGRGAADALAGESVALVLNARTAETLEATAVEIRSRYGGPGSPDSSPACDARWRARV